MAFAVRLQNNFQHLKNRYAFPLLVAMGALVFYAATMSHGVTFASLPFAAKIAGWDWLPLVSHPLAWLLTLPLRLLPGGRIPGALNFFSALLAAATLGILARSVQLLEWDCPPDTKKKWLLWLPALLACALCGLEFNFWSEATAMTGELLELLLFAAVVWCLLEFRAGKNFHWLDAAAVIGGLGLAENWAMPLLLPFFILALLWVCGPVFFERRFLARLALLGLTGFSIIVVQPIVNGLLPHSPLGFGESWLASLQAVKNSWRMIFHNFCASNRVLTLMVLLYFLVPLVACLLRIKNEAASAYGVERMQIWIFRLLRVGLLLVCVWLAFDPEVGPRKIIFNQLKLLLPLLTLDYLLALGAAFLLGSLLFAAQVLPRELPFTPQDKFTDFLRRSVAPLLTLFAVAAVAALALRSGIGIAQQHAATRTASGEVIVRSLPVGGGILLASDRPWLMTVQAALARHGNNRRWQTVDLLRLPAGRYRATLERKIPLGWVAGGTADLTDIATLQLLIRLSATNRIFYLHPLPGQFLLEAFYPQPAGAAHELKIFATNAFARPPLTSPQIADNEKFWDAAWSENLETVSRVVAGAAKGNPQWLAISPVVPESVRQVGRWFSVSLNNWGVELQRSGELAEARHRLEQALALNPDNAAAQLNLECNSNLLAGNAMDLSAAPAVAKNAANITQLARLMEVSGVVDEAVICAVLGNACFNANWPRQALQQFDRARVLATNSIAPELAMGKIFAYYRLPEKVFETVNHLRRFETNSPAGRALGLELSLLEARAWLDETNWPAANRALAAALGDADDQVARETVLKSYLMLGMTTNALAILDRMLAQDPDNIAALNNKAAVLLQTQHPDEALTILDHVLSLTNLPSVKLNRAIALVKLRDFTAAEAAYRELQTATVDQFRVNYGLAQIAEARQDTNAAVKFYLACLTNAPPESVNWREARTQLDALHSAGKP
jgi:tetratricopeptide (TPR) repeat protein